MPNTFIVYILFSISIVLLFLYFFLKQRKELIVLKNNSRVLNDILTHSRDSYIVLDHEYVIRSISPNALTPIATTIYGTDEKSFLGKSFKDLFPDLIKSDFFLKCELAKENMEVFEFDHFFPLEYNWFNVKIQTINNELVIYYNEITEAKFDASLNDAEIVALEEFSKRDISFYQIIAKSMDVFQDLFPGMFCAIYLKNDVDKELNYFSSGYSTLLKSIPKSIKYDSELYNVLLNDNLSLEKGEVHFELLNDLFSIDELNKIYTKPIILNQKTKGVALFYFEKQIVNVSIDVLLQKVLFFIEKLFNYRRFFRKLEKLSIISENSLKAYATINLDRQMTWSNTSFRNIFNQSKESSFLHPISEILNEKNIEISDYINILESFTNFSNLSLSFTLNVENEEVKHLRLSTYSIFPEDEVQLLIELEDITIQQNHERVLIEKQDFLNKITNTVPIVLFQCQIDIRGSFNIPFISNEFERLDLGYTINEIINNPEVILGLIHPHDLPIIIKTIEIAQQKLLLWDVEFRVVTKKGSILWIKGTGVHELVDNVFIWNGYLENITDKKEKLKEIENINERFTYASKAVNEVIWELNLLNNEMTWSDGMTTIFGYSKEFYPEFDNLVNFIHADDYLIYSKEFELNLADKKTELFSLEYRFKMADGTFANVQNKAFVLRDIEGAPQRIIGSIKDVSDSLLFEKKKKELINETQEFERNQFSMELHDGLAQQLVALNLYLSILETDLDEEQKQKIEMCKKIVLESLNQTRTLCYNLSPPELSNGLISGLKSLFDRLQILSGVSFKLDYDVLIDNQINENIDIYNVYRIIQEFINNALKHSDCTEIVCKLTFAKKTQKRTIKIHDNGNGFDMANVKFGFGIQNMHKRAKLANATIKITSNIGEGAELLIKI